jgi:hypothetical protein
VSTIVIGPGKVNLSRRVVCVRIPVNVISHSG